MRDFSLFVRAIWQHGLQSVTGIVVTVAGLLWQLMTWINPSLSGPAFRPWMLWGIGLCLCFYAAFLAWRDEHDKTASRRNFELGFATTAHFATKGDDINSDGLVVLVLTAINRGPATILRDWQLHFLPPSQTSFIRLELLDLPATKSAAFGGPLPGIGGRLIKDGAETFYEISGADSIQRKTEKRIETGDWASGFMVGIGKNVTRADLMAEGVTYKATCRDAFGEQYEAVKIFRVLEPSHQND